MNYYWKNKEVDSMSESELRNNLKEAINEIDKLQQNYARAIQAAASTRPIKNNR